MYREGTVLTAFTRRRNEDFAILSACTHRTVADIDKGLLVLAGGDSVSHDDAAAAWGGGGREDADGEGNSQGLEGNHFAWSINQE
jgi:hypothetical protein